VDVLAAEIKIEIADIGRVLENVDGILHTCECIAAIHAEYAHVLQDRQDLQ